MVMVKGSVFVCEECKGLSVVVRMHAGSVTRAVRAVRTDDFVEETT